MNVLFVSPEVNPIVRTGGLGDVVGSLPLALQKIGVDVRVICPLHRVCQPLPKKFFSRKAKILWDGESITGQIAQTEANGFTIYLLDIPTLYDRPGVYADSNGNYEDNALRSVALCQAAVQLDKIIHWTPDVFHAHDWMAAATSAYLNATIKSQSPPPSVLTIHNLEHQGVFTHDDFLKSGLPRNYWGMDGFEHQGQFNLLKGGIQHANKITTVSPTYSQEIRTPEYGCDLEESLKYRGADIIGILNGIDESDWDPAKDSALSHSISPARPARGKKLCKLALLQEMGLPESPQTPLFGVVSRLYSQKGLDLLGEILPGLIESKPGNYVILGSGAQEEENRFQHLAQTYPDRLATYIGFDDGLARRIFAGSDFFVMPSRFEPCGLAQQYAMHYGSIPIARKTGGLADTISPWGKKSPHANGFLFDEATPPSLLGAMEQALELYAKPRSFHKIRKNALHSPCSWENAARHYLQCYHWVTS